jgi:predicted exporter
MHNSDPVPLIKRIAVEWNWMTATAFGSLWFSRHPGISNMGKLLALSLLCTLAAAALYQPALMGPARKADLADRAEHLP